MSLALVTNDDPEIPLDDEPAVPVDDPEIPIEPDAPATLPESPAALAPVALMQVLPADFPLPSLIRFIPDPALRQHAEAAAAYALSLEVRGAEGLQAADVALTALRTSQKGIEAHFDDPITIANALHKSLTSTRSDWLAAGKAATETVGRRVYVEQQRLQVLADEARRKAQDEANRQAREQARLQAEAAAKANAPKAVVENLRQQAQTAQAAPVSVPAAAPPLMRGTTIAKCWTVTIKGTPRDDANQQPSIEEATEAQREQLRALMQAILDGKAPEVLVTWNWKAATKLAKAGESTFRVAGLESYDAGSVRAKASRGR